MPTPQSPAEYVKGTGLKMNMPIPKARLDSTSVTAVMDFTEIQTYLRIDGTADQTLVENLISAVTKKVEEHLGRKLINQIWSIFYDYFPSQSGKDSWWDGVAEGHVGEMIQAARFLELPFGPCQSISSFKTFDDDNTEYVFSSSLYNVDTVGSKPKIMLKRASTWPSTTLRSVNGIQVTGTFGYGSSGASVPGDIKEAVRIMVANLYEHRGDSESDKSIPNKALALLEPHRKFKV